jgi:hypothetical protein
VTRAEIFADKYTEGLKLLEAGKDDEANALFYDAAKTAPEGWLALAIELAKQGRHEEAIPRLAEVLKLTKNSLVRASALNQLGAITAHGGNLDAAERMFFEAAKLAPQYADIHCNTGLVYQWRHDYKTALRHLNNALSRDPWHESAQFVRAMNYLLDGDYKTGFAEYECRWRSKNNGLRKVVADCPEWNGHNGKRLYVYGEQGFGDSILMLRYAKEIKKRGVWLCWVAQKGLEPILHTIPEIDRVLNIGEAFDEYDCHIPAVSLPHIFGTTIDNIPPAPYLTKPEPFDYGPGFHVGIVWRGSKAQINDKIRSTNLSEWIPVFRVNGATFHSLQVDSAEEALLFPVLKTYDKPNDFIETARRVAGLDLVISVDTSMVHLCGAMGVPCWCALHCRPYFVFPPRLGTQTPWYQSVKLYRQQKEFEWNEVFTNIANDLCKLIQS